jgi:hypothetical protein|nr:MAG TPA: hypothetical protein [Caudoviricetes sp.]
MATIYQVKTYEHFEELLQYLYDKEYVWVDKVCYSITDEIWGQYKSRLGLYVDDYGVIYYGLFKEMLDFNWDAKIVKANMPVAELRKSDNKALSKDFIDNLQYLSGKIVTIEELYFLDESEETWASHLNELYVYAKHTKELIEEYDNHLAYILANDDE